MPSDLPQNPVYPVDPAALEACRPKAVCADCGTVFCLKSCQSPHIARCPTCGTRHRAVCEGDRWRSEILAMETTPE